MGCSTVWRRGESARASEFGQHSKPNSAIVLSVRDGRSRGSQGWPPAHDRCNNASESPAHLQRIRTLAALCDAERRVSWAPIGTCSYFRGIRQSHVSTLFGTKSHALATAIPWVNV